MLINPKDIPIKQMVSYLQGTVIPRPIALVSTINKQGEVNLSPFSFFNVFSLNPPILVFSASRRVRDNSTKHTLQNVLEIPEAVIHMVHYDMVEQTSLSSCEYEKGVSEFDKAGFTSLPSHQVLPPRVKEAKVAFECQVQQVIPLGKEGGAGHLIVCQIEWMHISDDILNEGQIDPKKMDVVARLGNDFYGRVIPASIFQVAKPNQKLGIGIDQIPEAIKCSTVLTGNDLGKLGNMEKLPTQEAINACHQTTLWQQAHQQGVLALHQLAKKYLTDGDIETAWKVLLP